MILASFKPRKPGALWALPVLATSTLAPLVSWPATAADWSFAAAHVRQTQADLDDGGHAEMDATRLLASVTGSATERLRFGADLRLEQQQWRFEVPAAYGGLAPWDELQSAMLGLQFHYALRPQWLLTTVPTLRLAREAGADGGDALSYGAALGLTRLLATDRRLGLGLMLQRDIEKTRVLPFVAIAWRFDEHWLFANAAPSGPAGQSAFELSYSASPNWSFAVGGGYRLERFRLDDEGAYGGAVVESRGAPVYARFAYTAPFRLRVELYAGALMQGELRIDEIADRSRIREKYDTVPIVGASFSLPL